MKTFYLIQLLSILFALASALHDSPAVFVFGDKGIPDYKNKLFHLSNWLMKFYFCVLAGIVGYYEGGAKDGVFLFFACGGWIYSLFDPFLSQFLGKGFFYLGEEAWSDNVWRKLGKNAGRWKVFTLIGICILLNLLYIRFT